MSISIIPSRTQEAGGVGVIGRFRPFCFMTFCDGKVDGLNFTKFL